jgi:D-threo-aldose 1-dehydrogenase
MVPRLGGMRKVAIPGTGVEIPIAGFGCSALTGTTRRNALQVLHSAFDSGIRHFDVARYYGYGEAERILGLFAKSRRTQITITTKFGIMPPRRTMALRMALRAGRRVMRLLPAARKLAQRRTAELIHGGAFSVKDAKSSLETSLRELRTDYIDFYLLHDYSLDDSSPEQLLNFLEGAAKSGKIRRFGIGTTIENTLRVLERQPELCGIVQFQNSVVTRNMHKLAGQPPDRLIITHGSLGADYPSLGVFLKRHLDTAKQWSDKLCVDCTRQETLSALMLNYAAGANPNGMILFSSRSPARVRKNAGDVLEPDLSAVQITLFGDLVRESLSLIGSPEG